MQCLTISANWVRERIVEMDYPAFLNLQKILIKKKKQKIISLWFEIDKIKKF